MNRFINPLISLAIIASILVFSPISAFAYSNYYNNYDSYYNNYSYGYYPYDYYNYGYSYPNYGYYSSYSYRTPYQQNYGPQYNYSGGCMFSGGIAAALGCGSNNYGTYASSSYSYGGPQYNYPPGHPIHQTGGIAGSLMQSF